MADTFDVTRLQKLEALINAYEDAILSLMTKGAIEEYQLNTGQGMQRVRRSDISKLQDTVAKMLQQRDALASRVYGSGVVQITPGTSPRC